MPQIGPLEILVVAFIALIVFGPEKLPQIARQVGRAAADLRRMATDVRDEFEAGLSVDDEPEPEREKQGPGEPEREKQGPGEAEHEEQGRLEGTPDGSGTPDAR